MQDQYLEISSAIPSDAQLFGLGERTSDLGFPLRRDGIPYVLWARDQPPTQPNSNLYGSHPFILDVRPGALPGPGSLPRSWFVVCTLRCCIPANLQLEG